jgi:hypothetical protein
MTRCILLVATDEELASRRRKRDTVFLRGDLADYGAIEAS